MRRYGGLDSDMEPSAGMKVRFSTVDDCVSPFQRRGMRVPGEKV